MHFLQPDNCSSFFVQQRLLVWHVFIIIIIFFLHFVNAILCKIATLFQETIKRDDI